MMEFIYHGTTESVAFRALREGLVPRNVSKRHNWGHTVPSNPDMVYLTLCYAPYFAMCSRDDSSGERIALVEIRLSALKESSLYPDEDFISQVMVGGRQVSNKILYKKTLSVRKRISEYQHLWLKSLNGMGTLGYKGIIPPEAFNRVSVCKPEDNLDLWLMAVDPTITVMNFKFCRGKYEALTRWYMGESVKAEELDMLFGVPVDKLGGEFEKALVCSRKRLESALKNQKVETIYERGN